jgi:hypothetical protein
VAGCGGKVFRVGQIANLSHCHLPLPSASQNSYFH